MDEITGVIDLPLTSYHTGNQTDLVTGQLYLQIDSDMFTFS